MALEGHIDTNSVERAGPGSRASACHGADGQARKRAVAARAIATRFGVALWCGHQLVLWGGQPARVLLRSPAPVGVAAWGPWRHLRLWRWALAEQAAMRHGRLRPTAGDQAVAAAHIAAAGGGWLLAGTCAATWVLTWGTGPATAAASAAALALALRLAPLADARRRAWHRWEHDPSRGLGVARCGSSLAALACAGATCGLTLALLARAGLAAVAAADVLGLALGAWLGAWWFDDRPGRSPRAAAPGTPQRG